MYISCIFHVVCASFSTLATQKLADAKAVFSGIWALHYVVSFYFYPQFLHQCSHVTSVTRISAVTEMYRQHVIDGCDTQ